MPPLDLAQRALCAVAILCRASALSVRTGDGLSATLSTPTAFTFAGGSALPEPEGRPGFRRKGAAVSDDKVLTFVAARPARRSGR